MGQSLRLPGYVLDIPRRGLLGLMMLVSLSSYAFSAEVVDVLRLSILPEKQSYSVGEDIGVMVSMKRLYLIREKESAKKEDEYYIEKNMVFPLLFFCESPYLSFSFVGEQPAYIASKEQHIETDLDLSSFHNDSQSSPELQQRINLNECYQLGKGQYTLHAVYDTTQRKAVCDACDEDEKVWSGILRSESITIEIIE